MIFILGLANFLSSSFDVVIVGNLKKSQIQGWNVASKVSYKTKEIDSKD